MIFPEELEEKKLYKNPLHLPLLDTDTRKGSAVFLLSPDLSSSINILKNPILRKRYYMSYYVERDVTAYIEEGTIVDEDQEVLSESTVQTRTNRDVINQYHLSEYLNQGDLDNEWLDKPFEYVEQGENIYNKLHPEALLETAISKIKLEHDKGKLGVDITYEEDIRLFMSKFKYNTGKLISLFFLLIGSPLFISSTIILAVYSAIFVAFTYNAIQAQDINKFKNKTKEQLIIKREKLQKRLAKETQRRSDIIDRINSYDKIIKEINDSEIKIAKSYKDTINEVNYIRAKDEDKEIVFGFDVPLSEAALNTKLKKYLRDERYRTPAPVIKRYEEIKNLDLGITRTYLSLDKYKEMNLFIDLAFYNTKFFESGIYSKDKLRLYNLYLSFLDRLVNDTRIPKAGYMKRTVLYPIIDWQAYENTPLDLILYALVKRDNSLLSIFQNIDFIVLTNHGYYKLDLSTLSFTDMNKINTLSNKLINNEPIIDDVKDSKKAIVSNIADTIEKNNNIKIHNLVGDSANKDKTELVNAINKAAENSNNTEDALDKLDKENDDGGNWLNDLVLKLANDEDTVNINATRRARMTGLQATTLNKKYKNKTFKQMIETSQNNEPLPETSLPIDTINDDWNHLTFTNFEKVYNVDDDIVRILDSFSTKEYPIAIKDIEIQDASTSEDYIKTYIVSCEDSIGQRFRLIFDIPKFIDYKFMWLRGNKKTFNRQHVLIPLSKTDDDTAQIVSNYKKIFIRRYGVSTPGKSCADADAMVKISKKYTGSKIKFEYGDNRSICKKYACPMDFVDMAGYYTSITSGKTKYYFNLDELYKNYGDIIDEQKGLPIGVDTTEKKAKILYWNMDKDWMFSKFIRTQLEVDDISEFKPLSESIKPANKYWYSQASILNNKIPLIVIAAYSYGLTTVLDKANIKYDLVDKKPRTELFYIKYNDGYLLYDNTYEASLLLNGLKECNTEDYSIGDINKKSMYLDFLDNYGGKIISDGLDNFKELMIDPITEDTMDRYKLPDDYIGLLLGANDLLADNEYVAHTCLDSDRYRSTEIIAGYTYQCLANSYGEYRTQMQKGRKVPMTIKKTVVIDAILADPTTSDSSDLNDLQIAEAMNTVSPKGLAGMNSDRSYNLDKRTFDKSMLNNVAMSTGFAGNVGINRQATIDSGIEGKRGYIKKSNPNEMSITKTFCYTEGINVYTATHDDPFRTAMSFIQTSKHMMRCKYGMPSLVSNGTDQAMPYLTSNTFAVNSKGPGKVVEKTDSYMIVKYKNGKSEYINLEDKIVKNSNGGFYITIKLDTSLKLGDTFKENEIIAYDKSSYSDIVGTGNLAYVLGPLVKCAVMETDEGYEDSAIITEWLSTAMTSDVVEKQEYVLSKDAIVYNIAKKGQKIKEGDSILLYQNAFEDADVNQLLKTLNDEAGDVEELGRINKTSHVEGVIQDIVIYRTCEKDELSPSLRLIVDKYEKNISSKRKAMEKHGVDAPYEIGSDRKLEATGQLKNVEDGVKIVFQLKYEDKMGIGDKLCYQNANKGIVKYIIPLGEECHSSYRPDEKLHTLVSIGAINGRMITSILTVGGLSKGMVELDRKVKDILGIKFKYLDEIMEDYNK